MRIRSFFAGLWRGLDALRKALHLIVLLLLFGLVLGVLRGSVPHVPTRAALVIAPEGELVEQLSGDPLARAFADLQGERQPQTLLWDLTDAIRAAASDRRIPVVVLDLDKLDSATQPTLEELASALREFRAAGKKVIAYGVELTQERYYLAAQADESYVDPMGFVLLEGYDRYSPYLKEALDKLGVDINVFRVGRFKSAVEIFTRSDMSAEDREETRAYLGALWGTYQEAVTRARRLKPEAVEHYVDTLATTVPAAAGNAPRVALEAGLVTGVKTELEVERRLIDLVGSDDSGDSFSAVSSADYARVVHAQRRLSGRNRVGVIVASGEILDGDQPPGTIGGDSTARLIREARLDKDVKAVLLRVNSPGGSVLASEEIYRELTALRAAGKPLVVSMSGYAASGGYYISAPADEIWASPATLTGSIGVFAIIPTIDRTLGKLGIGVDGVGTTSLSGQARLDRPLGPAAKVLLQSQIDRTYQDFLERVASGRKKSHDQVDAIAQGRVWAGIDARRLGLVDQLGSFNEALKAAARRAKLTEFTPKFLEPKMTWLQQLVLNFKTSLLQLFASARGRSELAGLTQRLSPLEHEAARLARFSEPGRVYAYCFCEVR
ncbi:MAG: signal peptide peptidase SppA [Gammaproteobacteria bacterium]|nr:signal peptide peptidase SppA [Gammaproteobacteria bacterium]